MKKKMNDKFEPGIYNYCDRWCQKCSKTEKCSLYFQEQKERQELLKEGKDPDDPKNAFLIMKRNLDDVYTLLSKQFTKEELELFSKPDPEYDRQQKDVENLIDKERLTQLSKKFSKCLHSYFETTPSLDISEYKEAFDKLSWHGTFIRAKIYRALSSKFEAKYEKWDSGKFSLEDSQKTGLVAYRSALIAKKSLELMDKYVVDFRLAEMIDLLENILKELDSTILKSASAD